MRSFRCGCGSRVYFDNDRCLRCGALLAFDPDRLAMRRLGNGAGEVEGRACANRSAQGTCNWLATEPGAVYCIACRLTEVVPDLTAPGRLDLYHAVERAKRRLVYSLLALGLPVEGRAEHPRGLAFHILADARLDGRGVEPPVADAVTTGHQEGRITINLMEADPELRERMRAALGEPYRTVLGHFRHESGHYYWQRLVAGERLSVFRRTFGDERQPYAEGLARHYRDGPPADWPARHVCAYAACHPLEDFAECWAHYLHMVDALETAAASGLTVGHCRFRDPAGEPDARGEGVDRFDDMVAQWRPLAATLNDLNRSLGLADAYPFALPPPVVDKLRFVHGLVQATASGRSPLAAGVSAHCAGGSA